MSLEAVAQTSAFHASWTAAELKDKMAGRCKFPSISEMVHQGVAALISVIVFVSIIYIIMKLVEICAIKCKARARQQYHPQDAQKLVQLHPQQLNSPIVSTNPTSVAENAQLAEAITAAAKAMTAAPQASPGLFFPQTPRQF